jgi:drug/metabolite transporter (DMT)-like permease
VLLYFVALERCHDTGTAALLNNMSPLFTAVFAAWFLRERITLRLGIAAVLAFAGVSLVLRSPLGLHLGAGEAAGLASAVFSGMAVTTIRASRASDNASTILLAFCVLGIVVALPFALPTWRPATPGVWGLALAVGLTSFLAQLMMTHAFGLVPATQGAIYQQLTPVFAFGLGAGLLGETLTPLAAVGALVTLGAVAFAALPSGRT